MLRYDDTKMCSESKVPVDSDYWQHTVFLDVFDVVDQISTASLIGDAV